MHGQSVRKKSASENEHWTDRQRQIGTIKKEACFLPAIYSHGVQKVLMHSAQLVKTDGPVYCREN